MRDTFVLVFDSDRREFSLFRPGSNYDAPPLAKYDVPNALRLMVRIYEELYTFTDVLEGHKNEKAYKDHFLKTLDELLDQLVIDIGKDTVLSEKTRDVLNSLRRWRVHAMEHDGEEE